MAPGALGNVFNDRPAPLGKFLELADTLQGRSDGPMAIRLFGGAGAEYQERYDIQDATFAMIVVKARRHAQQNERAIFRKQVTVEDVLASPGLRWAIDPLAVLPTNLRRSRGGGCTEEFARRHGLDKRRRHRGARP